MPNPTPRSNAAIYWALLFAAVLSRLPAVATWFFGTDFHHLIDSGAPRTPGAPAIAGRVVDWIWSAQLAVFGADAAALHTVGLLRFALLCVALAATARALGMSRPGAAAAGFWLALSPLAIRPIAWTSASPEVISLLLSVVAIYVTARGLRGLGPVIGLFLSAMALLVSSAGIAVALILPWVPVAPAPRASRAALRVGQLALVALAGAAIVAPGGLWPQRALSVSLAGLAPMAGAASLPFSPLLVSSTLRTVLGATVLTVGTIGSTILLARKSAASALIAGLGLLAGGLSLAFPVPGSPPSGLGLSIAVSVWFGSAIGGLSASRIEALRPSRKGLALALALLLTAGLGFVTARQHMTLRNARGRLADPMLHKAAIAGDVRASFDLVRGSEADRPSTVAVLQASRAEFPEGALLPENAVILAESPVFGAMAGAAGLLVAADGDFDAHWVGNLEDLPRDVFVFFDAGDDRLHPWGTIENARLYSAIVAVAGGQYERARTDLWGAMLLYGAQVRFAFDPDHLPISPAELDAEAVGFARYVQGLNAPWSERMLHLFGQLYESVRGEELLIEGFGGTLRAPR